MTRSEFSAQELALLAEAAVLAGATVAIAKHSGTGGTRSEFRAIVDGLSDAARRYPENRLVQALATPEAASRAEELWPQFRSAPTQNYFQDFKMAAVNRCYSAAELLASKASAQEAAEVRESIVGMCAGVAAVAREGGFLGFGGTPVDPMETAVITELSRALGEPV